MMGAGGSAGVRSGGFGGPRASGFGSPRAALRQAMPRMTVKQARELVARSVGDAFLRVRAEVGITQGQLGAHLGVTAASVSAVERGSHLLSIERLLVFCDLFGLRPDEVLLGHQPKG